MARKAVLFLAFTASVAGCGARQLSTADDELLQAASQEDLMAADVRGEIEATGDRGRES